MKLLDGPNQFPLMMKTVASWGKPHNKLILIPCFHALCFHFSHAPQSCHSIVIMYLTVVDFVCVLTIMYNVTLKTKKTNKHKGFVIIYDLLWHKERLTQKREEKKKDNSDSTLHQPKKMRKIKYATCF